MGRLPDGTNPYGRMLNLMRDASPDQRVIVRGEYVGDNKYQIGDFTFERDEVLMLQGTTSGLQKGDPIIAYQLDDEDFIIFGKVV